MTKILAFHNTWELLNGSKTDTIVYKEAPEHIVNLFLSNGFYIYKSETCPVGAILIKGWLKEFPSEDEVKSFMKNINEEAEDADTVHFIGSTGKPIYRRHRLNGFLKKTHKVSTMKMGFTPMKEGQTLIVSDPRGSSAQVAEAEKHHCRIIYDRTDLWRALPEYPFCEDEILEKADKIFCSSRYIYEDCHREEKYLFENASDPYTYYPVEKKNIAVYVGTAEGKVDEDYCKKLQEEHPDYQFVSIGYEIPGFINYKWMDKPLMMRYLSKCRIGLLPVKNDEYRKGQFSLKVWDYINAHLSVVSSLPYNYSKLKNVHNEWTESFCEEKGKTWDELFKEMEREIYA